MVHIQRSSVQYNPGRCLVYSLITCAYRSQWCSQGFGIWEGGGGILAFSIEKDEVKKRQGVLGHRLPSSHSTRLPPPKIYWWFHANPMTGPSQNGGGGEMQTPMATPMVEAFTCTTGNGFLSKWSIISHFSFTSSTCLFTNGSLILILTSSFPPTAFLPSINWKHHSQSEDSNISSGWRSKPFTPPPHPQHFNDLVKNCCNVLPRSAKYSTVTSNELHKQRRSN